MFRPNRRDGSFTFKVIDQKEYAAQHVIALRVSNPKKTDFLMMYVYKTTECQNLLNYFNLKN